MDKISGIILDVYDDVDGEVVRQLFPTAESLPDMIKQAHSLTTDEQDGLPDDMFALVLLNGDQTLRKYACVDEGNTALSVEYFLLTRHKLPDEAQKTAAANLLVACGWYDIDPPEELEKVALGALGVAFPAMGAALTLPGAVKETKANLRATKGPNIVTPKQRQAMLAASGFPHS